MPSPETHWLSQQIIRWQKTHGRNALPWQNEPTPYRVWVSEIMLQQTQVTTVIDYYQRFMRRFPRISTLAQADEDAVLSLWSGLGYYSRARNLHKTAQIIHHQHGGRFPDHVEGLQALPGIGRSTGAAILALSHEKREAILDGNVKRVLCRFHAVHGWPGNSAVEKQLWKYAEQHLPQQHIRTYTQGMMDLGATLCTRTRPKCEQCPLDKHCLAYMQGISTQIPSPRPKKTRPKKQATLLMLFDQEQQILLEKRPPTGIWGGLWSPPHIDVEINHKTGHYQGVPYKVFACANKIKHQFSHFQLTITPLYAIASPSLKIMEQPDHGWYNTRSIINLGLAAPIKKLLKNGLQPYEFNL